MSSTRSALRPILLAYDNPCQKLTNPMVSMGIRWPLGGEINKPGCM